MRKTKRPRQSRPVAPPPASRMLDATPGSADDYFLCAGAGQFFFTETEKTPIKFLMKSADGIICGLLEITAESDILVQRFVHGAFEHRRARMSLCGVEFRAHVRSHDKRNDALLIEGAPFFAAIARFIAAGRIV